MGYCPCEAPIELVGKCVRILLEPHVIAGKRHRVDTEPARQRSAHLVDRLAGRSLAEHHHDLWRTRLESLDIRFVERQRQHAVREPIFEIAGDPLEGFGRLRGHVECRRPVLRIAIVEAAYGEERGHRCIDALAPVGLVKRAVSGYHLAHSARAEMLRRLGCVDDARAAYRQALALCRQPAERRCLTKRLAALAN